jgi:small neutral amino acid transporter SnatA (MarC family)
MTKLADAHRLARRTATIIRQNLIVAIGAMGILVTGGLFFDLPLPLAVIGHEGGTVLVVLNGLRLLSDRIRSGDGNVPAHRQPNSPAPASSVLRSQTTSPTAS